MGYGQMLMFIGAIVLFTTVVLTMNFAIGGQIELVYRYMYMNQGVKVSEKCFDKIHTEAVLGDVVDFDNIEATYSGIDSVQVGDVWYIFNIYTHYTDESGNDVAGPSDYQRVDVKVWTNPFVIIDTLRFDNLFKRFS